VKYIEWVDYFSSGKLQIKMDFLNYWIRMPQETGFYKLRDNEGENDLRKGQQGNVELAQLYVDEITKFVDLSQYRTIFLIFPSDPKPGVLATDLPPRMVEFKIKEGSRVMSLFAGIGGGYDYSAGTPYWALWVHEMSHDWGLDGHAPGNGWPFNILTNQGGSSKSMNAWDRFLLTWLPDDQVYCEKIETLKISQIKLSPLERKDFQTKMIAVALNDHKLLVVEAHGLGDWFSPNTTVEKESSNAGLYYIVVYTVDTQFQYPNETIVNADGSALHIDDGVNRSIPRHAYLYPVDGGKGSNNYGIKLSDTQGVDYSSFLGIKGDTFTVEGVRITFLETGDFETIEISKA
jgi:hypothetical protein